MAKKTRRSPTTTPVHLTAHELKLAMGALLCRFLPLTDKPDRADEYRRCRAIHRKLTEALHGEGNPFTAAQRREED